MQLKFGVSKLLEIDLIKVQVVAKLFKVYDEIK